MNRRERRAGDLAAVAVALVFAMPLAIVMLASAIAGLLARGQPCLLYTSRCV